MHVMRSPSRIANRLLAAVGWLVAAALVAAGSAGVVAGVGGPPTVVPRAELTWGGDEAIRPGLEARVDDLRGLSDDVDRLGVLGRGALAALAARDETTLSNTIDEGSALVVTIQSDAGAIRGRLRALPGIDGQAPPLLPATALTLGPATEARYTQVDTALRTTTGLSDAWVRLTAGSLAAMRLSTLLADHDTSTAAAARQGRGGHYAAALSQLGTSDRLIDEASKLRDTLENSVDVSTLTRWLDLNVAYDTALRRLYDALRRSNGRLNNQVRAAITAEAKAHDELPPDTRALVVIMGEVARGGLNQAVIGIEDARGDLSDAIDALSDSATS